MVGGNWLKSIFFLFLDHLPGFPNYTFLNFQKKFFSLHPNVQSNHSNTGYRKKLFNKSQLFFFNALLFFSARLLQVYQIKSVWRNINNTANQINKKLLLYTLYCAEACNEFAGPSPSPFKEMLCGGKPLPTRYQIRALRNLSSRPLGFDL